MAPILRKPQHCRELGFNKETAGTLVELGATASSGPPTGAWGLSSWPEQCTVTGSGVWTSEGRWVRVSEGRVPHPRAGCSLLRTLHSRLEHFLPWNEAPPVASSPLPHSLPDLFPRPGSNSLPAQQPLHNPSCPHPSHQTHSRRFRPSPRGLLPHSSSSTEGPGTLGPHQWPIPGGRPLGGGASSPGLSRRAMQC